MESVESRPAVLPDGWKGGWFNQGAGQGPGQETGTGGRAHGRRRSVLGSMGRGIGPRLLGLILLFSSLVAALSTLIQLYTDYRRDVGAIESRLDEIGHSYLNSLTVSLWNLDALQLKVQLEGMLRLPDLQAAEVRESSTVIEHPLVVTAGQPLGADAALSREYPLIYDDRGELRMIGRLKVEVTLSGVYHRLLDKTVVILATQAVKTFLVSLFTLYIVHRLVTRHLTAVSDFLSRYDLRRGGDALRLRRRAPASPDELDHVVNAFNAMCTTLQRAYDDLLEAHAEMERDVIARRQAEEEVIRLNARLEQQVRQRTAELEAANKELSAFSYSVSHDLRAPLRRIEGFGRMLADDYAGQLDERGVHYLNRMRHGARDMSEMIDSFLTLSRVTQTELAIQPVDLGALARDVVDALREKEPHRQVTVTIAPDLTAEGDARLLRQALGNLLENAWKYSRRTENATIEVAMRAEQGRKVFFVRDNGAGFDMESANVLFTPFSRLHRAEDFEGTGIGLATVKSIIVRHGGRVWAESRPEHGATFYFTLWDKGATP